jgi:toxin-antitoxin system PIN domain toxin
MTSYLIDINVWLALSWDQHPQHVPASRWYASIDDAALLFCRLTMLGFLRLLTNGQVMGDSTMTLAGALELYDQWRQDPRVELAAEPGGTEGLFRQAMAPHSLQPATKAIADCYLAGFAEAAGAQLVTFDVALAATAHFRQVPVALLEPVDKRARVAPPVKPGRGGRHSTR